MISISLDTIFYYQQFTSQIGVAQPSQPSAHILQRTFQDNVVLYENFTSLSQHLSCLNQADFPMFSTYFLLNRSNIIKRTKVMEICSHSLSSNSKDCKLCRVKREVGLTSKTTLTTFRRSIKRHQSQATLRSVFGEQPSKTAAQDSNASLRTSNQLAENNQSKWNGKVEQQRMKTLQKMKARRAQINWSLFQPQRHRPRFDRWQSKLLNKMREKGKGQQLLHHMSIF